GGTGAGKLGTVRDAFMDETKSKEENRKALLTTGLRLIEETNAKTKKQDEEELNQYFKEKERTPWDCQTILTTYSTLDNHPATIYEKRAPQIKVNRRTGFPMVQAIAEDNEDVDMDGGAAAANGDSDEEVTKENKGKPRPKDESKEEKRARKKQIQEDKRGRREVKKETREVFAEKKDRKKQSKQDRAQYVVHLV
ncbi:hypothetical protein IWW38_005818, partial [Coemansia aciculifera]